MDKRLEDITEADLRALIEAEVREGKQLEYKREINLEKGEDKKDDPKRKFLASICSFANAAGGDVVFGIAATEGGVAKEITALQNFNPDRDILKLRDLIRSHIEPKVQGVDLQPIQLGGGGFALVIRVPKTWVGAHMVAYNNDHRFYSRDGNGRRLMDISEIRMGFSTAEQLPVRIQQLRQERVSELISGDTPRRVDAKQFLVIHILPAQCFDSFFRIDKDSLLKCDGENLGRPLRPFQKGWSDICYDFDGVFKWSGSDNACSSITKVYFNGILESLDVDSVSSTFKGQTEIFYPSRIESQLFEVVPGWLKAMEAAKISPPLFLGVSLIGLSGKYPYVNPATPYFETRSIRQWVLHLPPQIIESYKMDMNVLLKPICDSLWNACGIPKSPSFDDEGIFRNL